MNLRLSQAVRWTGRATYATVRYSARLAHRFTLAVGLIAILIALTFWLSPLWRQAFTAQLRMVFSATAPPDFGVCWRMIPVQPGCAIHQAKARSHLEHFSVNLPKKRARRQYAQYGEREAT